jgi:hypothetical protein
MLAITIVEALAIVVLGILVVGLLRSHAEILRSLDELGAGRDDNGGTFAVTPGSAASGSAYDVEGELLDGSVAAVGIVGADVDTVLAFLSGTCSTCETFWSAFAEPSLALPGNTRLVIVVEDLDDPTRVASALPPGRLVVRSSAAWRDYAVPGAPHFVHVDGPSGQVVGEGTGASWAQIESLLLQASRGRRRSLSLLESTVDAGRPEDNPTRVDRELLAAGIGPGHPSLYVPVDADTAAETA